MRKANTYSKKMRLIKERYDGSVGTLTLGTHESPQLHAEILKSGIVIEGGWRGSRKTGRRADRRRGRQASKQTRKEGKLVNR